ncbi:MAG: hypothetical protein AAFR64_13960 [Pseudomonadota bacterium]
MALRKAHDSGLIFAVTHGHFGPSIFSSFLRIKFEQDTGKQYLSASTMRTVCHPTTIAQVDPEMIAGA